MYNTGKNLRVQDKIRQLEAAFRGLKRKHQEMKTELKSMGVLLKTVALDLEVHSDSDSSDLEAEPQPQAGARSPRRAPDLPSHVPTPEPPVSRCFPFQASPSPQIIQVKTEFVDIARINSSSKSQRIRGRVSFKSNLCQFKKPDGSTGHRFHFCLLDASSEISFVCWQDAEMKYPTFQVNELVAAERFNILPNDNRAKALTTHRFWLSYNQSTKVERIDGAEWPTAPRIPFNFRNLAEFKGKPPGSRFDVLAVCIKAGNVFQEGIDGHFARTITCVQAELLPFQIKLKYESARDFHPTGCAAVCLRNALLGSVGRGNTDGTAAAALVTVYVDPGSTLFWPSPVGIPEANYLLEIVKSRKLEALGRI